MMKSLLVALALFSIAECLVEFDHSFLYDMEDLKGTPWYNITVCEDTGCRVYLTYQNEAPDYLGDKYLAMLTIEFLDPIDPTNNITFFDLNNLKLDNDQKGFFDIPVGTKKFAVHNPNPNPSTRPLALWVVKNTAPFLDSVEIYEAADKAHIGSSARRIMLMSVDPFILSASIEDDYSLTVKTSPFDMLSNAECEYVVKTDSTITRSLSLPFESPIISLDYDSKKPLSFDIEFGYPYDRSIDSAGYMSSPGYIGCWNKTFVFRSESYNFGVVSWNETYVVAGETARHIHLYGDLNTDGDAPIILTDLVSNEETIVLGMQADNTSSWEYDLETSSFSVAWYRPVGWNNQSFMIRYEVDFANTAAPKTTGTSTTVLPKSSPTVPTVHTTKGVASTSTTVVVPEVTTQEPFTTFENSSPVSSTTVDVTTTSSSSISVIVSLISVATVLFLL